MSQEPTNFLVNVWSTSVPSNSKPASHFLGWPTFPVEGFGGETGRTPAPCLRTDLCAPIPVGATTLSRSSGREVRIRVPVVFSVVYFSRGTLLQQRNAKRALGDLVVFASLPNWPSQKEETGHWGLRSHKIWVDLYSWPPNDHGRLFPCGKYDFPES